MTIHAHDNQGSLNKISESGGKLQYDGEDVQVGSLENVLYVDGLQGNDSYSGDFCLPKATISAAISTASSGTTVVVLGAGTYSEDITCVDSVNIYAPYAILDLGSSGDQLNLADCEVVFNKITRTSGGNAAILSDAVSGTAHLRVGTIDDSGSGITIRNTQPAILMLNIGQMYVRGGGTAIANYATGGDHIHVQIGDIYLDSNSAVGIASGNSGTLVGHIDHILESGTRTGTVALDVDAGTLDLFVSHIEADTAYDVSGGELNLICANIDGTKTETGGTVNLGLIVDSSLHSALSSIPNTDQTDGVTVWNDSGVLKVSTT